VELSRISLSDKFKCRTGAPVADLEDSIEACGLISPIMVNRKLELVAGGRRYQALKNLGWKMVPVVFMDGSDVDAQIANVDENLMRRDFKRKDELFWINVRYDLYCQKYPERQKAREEWDEKWDAMDHSDMETEEEFEAFGVALNNGTIDQFEKDKAAGKFKKKVLDPLDESTNFNDEKVVSASKPLKMASPDFSNKLLLKYKSKKSRGRPATNRAEFIKESAKATGLSQETFRRDLKLKEDLIPEAFQAVTSGEISMAHGNKLARLEKQDQLPALKRTKDLPAKSLDKKSPENFSKTFFDALGELRDQLQFQSAFGGTFDIKEYPNLENQMKSLEMDVEFFKEKLWGVDAWKISQQFITQSEG